VSPKWANPNTADPLRLSFLFRIISTFLPPTDSLSLGHYHPRTIKQFGTSICGIALLRGVFHHRHFGVLVKPAFHHPPSLSIPLCTGTNKRPPPTTPPLSRLRYLRDSKRHPSKNRKPVSRPRSIFTHRPTISTSLATSRSSMTTTLDPRAQLVYRILLRHPVSIPVSIPTPHWVRFSLAMIPDRDIEILRRQHTHSRPLTIRVLASTTFLPDREAQVAISTTTAIFLIHYSISSLHFVYAFSLARDYSIPFAHP